MKSKSFIVSVLVFLFAVGVTVHTFTGDVPELPAAVTQGENTTQTPVEVEEPPSEQKQNYHPNPEPAPEVEPEAAPETVPAPAENSEASQIVYVTQSGSKYHNAGCQYLKKSQIEISLADAKSQGYTACSRCH